MFLGTIRPLTFGDCFQVWVSAERENRFSAVKQLIMNEYNINNPDEPELTNISYLVCATLKSKWEKCSRIKTYLLKKESGFLATTISVPCSLISSASSSKDTSIGTSLRGRPEKQFAECSEKTKRRKVEPLLQSFSQEQLRFAVDISHQSTSAPSSVEEKLSLQQTLALYLDLDLSERKYGVLRTVVNSIHKNTFPSLYRLNLFKKTFFPEFATVSETVVEVNILDMLNKTLSSIAELVSADCIENVKSTNLSLVCKWGMDGSSGHSTYKQTFSDESATDEFLFFIAFVSIMLVEKKSGLLIWKNQRSSSSLYCRPLKFLFSKENRTLVNELLLYCC